MNKQLVLLGVIALASTYLFIGALKAQNQPQLSGYDPVIMKSFQDWQATYGKKYDDPDLTWYRFTVFADNYNRIEQVNAQQSSFTLGQNEFMDLTFTEFQNTYLLTKVSAPTNVQPIIGTEGVADSIDWRQNGAVTEVKNQGQCGSCWAFSTTGALESFVRVQNKGETRIFSEQDLVDCSRSFGNQGCNGGLMDQAFQYVIKNGIANEVDYPYLAVDQACKNVTRNQGILKTFVDVPSGNTDQLKAAVNRQPIAIAVAADSNWQQYRGGVLTQCGSQLDHGVLLVGYEKAGNWIVKNSWGTNWGEQGFIRLAPGNTCLLANAASYPQ